MKDIYSEYIIRINNSREILTNIKQRTKISGIYSLSTTIQGLVMSQHSYASRLKPFS